MPDDHFRRHFPLSKETVLLLYEELAGELKAERETGLSVEQKIFDADMRILTVYPMQPESDHDSFVWRMTWLGRWFQAGRIANPGDSGYPLDPSLLSLVPSHAPMQTAEGKYNTAHAAMRSVVERCIGLLMSRFRCLQWYCTLLYEPERVANIVAAWAVLHTQP
ncbi:hypothetical protein HPB49_008199 [Dermacentor silvarum]|uniref:Uncharacterized protein n=1 Tax=Dermacentor silvarum TaxID=543639 RepID=A0ACB8C2P6_DERSI|nr:hypothetical protein HPB49_008199 [Dermacentor silvarum]